MFANIDSKNLILHAHRNIMKCKVLIKNFPKKETKISKEWRNLCTFNQLKEGDIILFTHGELYVVIFRVKKKD